MLSSLTGWMGCRDPHNTRTYAEIIDALTRAWLLSSQGPADPVVEAKFSLDSAVSDEGGCSLHLLSIAKPLC